MINLDLFSEIQNISYKLFTNSFEELSINDVTENRKCRYGSLKLSEGLSWSLVLSVLDIRSCKVLTRNL